MREPPERYSASNLREVILAPAIHGRSAGIIKIQTVMANFGLRPASETDTRFIITI